MKAAALVAGAGGLLAEMEGFFRAAETVIGQAQIIERIHKQLGLCKDLQDIIALLDI